MQIQFECLHCEQPIIADTNLIGVSLPCPHCSLAVIVPNPLKSVYTKPQNTEPLDSAPFTTLRVNSESNPQSQIHTTPTFSSFSWRPRSLIGIISNILVLVFILFVNVGESHTSIKFYNFIITFLLLIGVRYSSHLYLNRDNYSKNAMSGLRSKPIFGIILLPVIVLGYILSSKFDPFTQSLSYTLITLLFGICCAITILRHEHLLSRIVAYAGIFLTAFLAINPAYYRPLYDLTMCGISIPSTLSKDKATALTKIYLEKQFVAEAKEQSINLSKSELEQLLINTRIHDLDFEEKSCINGGKWRIHIKAHTTDNGDLAFLPYVRVDADHVYAVWKGKEWVQDDSVEPKMDILGPEDDY